MKDAHLGSHRSIVVDTVLTHELGDPNGLQENAARVPVERLGNRRGTTHAFLPCALSSSGRIHGEFLRLLNILIERRTQRCFASLDEKRGGVLGPAGSLESTSDLPS